MIEIFTDGSSLGNPGPGGFCALIKQQKTENKKQDLLIIKGGENHTTNNRMEMAAIIAGLYAIHKKFPDEREVAVYSDSNLIISTINHGWKRKKNHDLWTKLDALIEKFEKIEWHWIRGHSGHPENMKADKVAVTEAKKRRSQEKKK